MPRLLLITIVFLGGCVTPPRPIPPELQYVAPTDQESSLATLVGSQEKGTPNDSIAYVLAVDGKLVMTGTQGWSTPLPIHPGPRNITVAFQGGGFNTQVDLQLQALADHKYQIQFSTDVRLFGASTYCDFWIIDIATKKPVTGIGCGGIVNPPY